MSFTEMREHLLAGRTIDVHMGVRQEVVDQATRWGRETLEVETFADGDSWEEWGGVEGNVSEGVDLTRRHVIYRVATTEDLRRVMSTVPPFATLAMEGWGDIVVATDSEDWSIVLDRTSVYATGGGVRR